MQIEVIAAKRDVQGTGASRRLRRTGKVPGVIYGEGKDALAIELDHKELMIQLRKEAFHSSVLTMSIDGSKESALLRDVQVHPYKPLILHVDFQRVSADSEIHLAVPLHFLNEETCPGVKLENGMVNHVMTEVEVTCLPSKLPEFIEVDLGNMSIGDSVHLSGLPLPDGVGLVDLQRGEDALVAIIMSPVVEEAEAAEGGAETGGGERAADEGEAED